MLLKPVIKVMINKTNENTLNELLAGIEEEGVFYEVNKGSETSSHRLAIEGTKLSQLQVGIGVSEETICVCVRNMTIEKPLFECKNTIQFSRNIGINAARYVKGLPFKNLDFI